MPVYDYRSTHPAKAKACCKEAFEVIQPIKDEALDACPECGGAIQRLITAPGFTTKGVKSLLSDANLKKNGFKRLVKEGPGKYRNTLV